MREQDKGYLTQARIELQIKLLAQDQNMVPHITPEPVIINDPQVHDHLRRLQDHHLIPVHPDLQVCLVDPEEVPLGDLIRDHPVEEGQEPVNVLTQKIYYEKNILIYVIAVHFFLKCTIFKLHGPSSIILNRR